MCWYRCAATVRFAMTKHNSIISGFCFSRISTRYHSWLFRFLSHPNLLWNKQGSMNCDWESRIKLQWNPGMVESVETNQWLWPPSWPIPTKFFCCSHGRFYGWLGSVVPEKHGSNPKTRGFFTRGCQVDQEPLPHDPSTCAWLSPTLQVGVLRSNEYWVRLPGQLKREKKWF